MPRTTVLLTVVAFYFGGGCTTSADDQIFVSYVSYNSGKAFESVITANAMERTPVWKESAANPPLSARDAIKIADAMKDKLVRDTEDGAWVREAMELRQATDDHWYWLARYQLDEGTSGPWPDLILVVLMDGTVVKPEIQPERRFRRSFDGSRRPGRQPSFFFLNGSEITDEGLASQRLKPTSNAGFRRRWSYRCGNGAPHGVAWATRVVYQRQPGD